MPPREDGERRTLTRIRNVLPESTAGVPRIGLLEWERAFIEWWAKRQKRPRKELTLQRANEFRLKFWDGDGDPDAITYEDIKRLRKRLIYKEYLQACQEGGILGARKFMEERYPEFIDAHVLGLRMAVQAQDYKEIPKYTNPVLDRVIPKKDRAEAAPILTVNISVEQRDLLAQPLDAIPEADYEVLTD